MIGQIAVAAMLYAVSAVFADGSCVEAVYDATRDCRVSEFVVRCPNPGPCEAADRAAMLAVTQPMCGQVNRREVKSEERERVTRGRD